jgi:hypothetical protein
MSVALSSIRAAAIGVGTSLAMVFAAGSLALDRTPSGIDAGSAGHAGAQMPDGTRFGGASPDTGRPMFTTGADAPLHSFGLAQAYCASFDAHGHRDWRMPTKAELNVLFQNRAAIGGFDTTGSDPAGWYWSSSRSYYLLAWAQRFSDGYQLTDFTHLQSTLRCVRG